MTLIFSFINYSFELFINMFITLKTENIDMFYLSDVEENICICIPLHQPPHLRTTHNKRTRTMLNQDFCIKPLFDLFNFVLLFQLSLFLIIILFILENQQCTIFFSFYHFLI